MNTVITQGVLSCEPVLRQVFVASMTGDLLAYSIDEGLLWRTKIRDFVGVRVEARSGGVVFTYAPPPGNYAQVPLAMVVLDEERILLQLMRQERSIVNGKVNVNFRAGIESVIVERASGLEIGRQSDVPQVLAASNGMLLLSGEDPEPWVELRSFRWRQGTVRK